MGQLIEFYKPEPKPPVVVPTVVEPSIAPADLLREVLQRAETIVDIAMFMRDKDGELGLVSNLDGAGDNILFMEQVKHEWLMRMRRDDGTPGPKGVA